MEGHSHRKPWKLVECLVSVITYHHVLVRPEGSRILFFGLVSALYLIYTRAHRPLNWKNNATYLVYSNSFSTVAERSWQMGQKFPFFMIVLWKFTGWPTTPTCGSTQPVGQHHIIGGWVKPGPNYIDVLREKLIIIIFLILRGLWGASLRLGAGKLVS